MELAEIGENMSSFCQTVGVETSLCPFKACMALMASLARKR